MMLRRKMLRDIRKNVSQFITIFLMILIGVMAFSGIKSYMFGMKQSAARFYETCNLQDLDAYGDLTSSDLEQIRNLDAVNDAEGKYTLLANVENHSGHKAELNFISSNNICKLHIVDGEAFSPEKTGLWVDSYYAEKAGIRCGDMLHITYQSLDINAPVLGLCNVPDHVYDTKDDTEIFPSHTDYGFVYLPVSMMTDPFLASEEVSRESYTSIMVDAKGGASISDLRTAIETQVASAQLVMDIHDEPSDYGYQREIEEGNTYVGIFSGLFIFIALLSVVTTMTRIVHRERTQIGTMKALGYSTARIAWHYVSYGLLLSALGGAVGLAVGYFGIGRFFLAEEMAYYEVPDWSAGMDPKSYFVYLGCILLVCVACYLTVYRLLRQSAADLLRVERPKVQNRSLRLTTGTRFQTYSFSTRWNLRDILRNKARSLTSLAGIVGCMVLIVAAFGIKDTINNYLKTEMEDINNYEYRMNLSPTITVEELMSLFENVTDRTSMTLSVDIQTSGGEKITTTAFVNDTHGSVQPMNTRYRAMDLSSYGVYVTQKFAALHGFKVGDTVHWKINGLDEEYESEIIGLNRDPQNQNMTMTRYYYQRLGLPYFPDSAYTDDDISGETIPGVSTIQSITSITDGVKDMMSTMNAMIVMLVFFAVVLAVVILYNMGILSFSEKDYQFATLKVLGFSNGKIGKLFRQQNIWITVAAIILGLPLGYLVTEYIFTKAIGDIYDFGISVRPLTCIIAAIGTFIVSCLVTVFLTRKIRSIDMVQSLKSNE